MRQQKLHQNFGTLIEKRVPTIQSTLVLQLHKIQQTTNFIRIADNITTSNSKPRNSVTIKREINTISSEKTNIKYTYTLSRGGIALHFKAEDVNKFENEVDNNYPGSTCSKSKSLGQYKKLFMKNINPSISAEQLILSLRQINDGKSYLRNFYSSRTYKALPIICVGCKVSICNNLPRKCIELLGSHFNCENYIKPVVRCFNYQKFGHISTNCFNKHCCEYCGKNCPSQQNCLQESLCVNCNTSGHPSTSQEYPKYKEKKSPNRP